MPYPVIPLTVIAIDMIIATLPLAVLLVEMIIESFTSISVDPLLAKNVLWWFGHPVVYLLLFPAVAIYYLLVPRYAKRPLVAGNIIAVGWTIAVIANVTVWAHHLYLDYPNGIQAAINTGMEPLTFALTIVSALSLYSLFLTIFRSRWTWNAASTALFLGLVSWLLAGLSGVVNATIAWDAFVHNTLWIVGHFHHMALLNIGIVIFGALYAFLPSCSAGRSTATGIGMWHVWLTFRPATLISVLWIIQGLDGAPRRFAVLPGRVRRADRRVDPAGRVLALAQLLLVWNIVQTLRGRTSQARSASPSGSPGRAHEPRPPGLRHGHDAPRARRPRRRRLGDRQRNQNEADAAFLPPRRAPAGGGRRPRAAGVRRLRLRRLPRAGRGGRDRHRGPEPGPGEAQRGPGGGPGHQRRRRDAGLRGPARPEQIEAVAAYVAASAAARRREPGERPLGGVARAAAGRAAGPGSAARPLPGRLVAHAAARAAASPRGGRLRRRRQRADAGARVAPPPRRRPLPVLRPHGAARADRRHRPAAARARRLRARWRRSCPGGCAPSPVRAGWRSSAWTAVTAGWYVPAAFERALATPWLHVAMQASILLTGLWRGRTSWGSCRGG